MLGQLHEAASGRSLAGQDLVERANQNKNNSVILYICRNICTGILSSEDL